MTSIVSSWCWRMIAAVLLLGAVSSPGQAQQVVDGLPPPPTLPAIEPALPPEFTQPAQPAPSSSLPAARPVERSTARRSYLVYVNGDSPLLLAQVRRIESQAFVQARAGEPVIQVGMFDEQARAEQQAAVLAQQGIEAEVVQIARASTPPAATPPNAVAANDLPPDLLPLTPVDRQVQFGQPLNSAPTAVAQSSSTVRGSSYYVAIPGRLANLPDISNLVTVLGSGLNVTESTVQERRSPRGPHVLVGPFVDRRTATRWNRYFRDFGMDARVYYRR